MFFDQLMNFCKEKNTTPTKFVTEILHLSSSKVTAWKNGSIPKYEILNEIANYFDVSVGTLFDGRNNNIKPLTTNEQELLENYSKLTDDDKKEVSARVKELTKETISEENLGKQRLMIDRINELAKKMGVSISAIEKAVGLSNGIIGKWRKQSPSCDKLKLVADYLNVSIDYLLTGKENQATTLTTDEQKLLENYHQLAGVDKKEVSTTAEELVKGISLKQNPDKQRLLKMYDLLTDMEKGEILGELKVMTKNRNSNIRIQTVRVVARSIDNAPPRMVTGDFSDILNAPDATDEY